jgi:hypothetical protein
LSKLRMADSSTIPFKSTLCRAALNTALRGVP